MSEQYSNNGKNYSYVFSITESDTTEYNLNAFMVGTAGNVYLKMGDMSAAVAVPALAGVIYPIGGKAVIFHTDTTASDIVGLR